MQARKKETFDVKVADTAGVIKLTFGGGISIDAPYNAGDYLVTDSEGTTASYPPAAYLDVFENIPG